MSLLFFLQYLLTHAQHIPKPGSGLQGPIIRGALWLWLKELGHELLMYRVGKIPHFIYFSFFSLFSPDPAPKQSSHTWEVAGNRKLKESKLRGGVICNYHGYFLFCYKCVCIKRIPFFSFSLLSFYYIM